MDYKSLLTKVERTLEQIENAGTRRLTIEQIADTLTTNFREQLGITGGRIYEAMGENTYEIVPSRVINISIDSIGPNPCIARRSP